jgi:hypothetical protein
MKKILLNTFLAVLFPCLISAIAVVGGNPGAAIVVLFLLIVCTAFPTYLVVIIYHYLKRKVLSDNKVYAVIFGALILFSICQICIVLYLVISAGEFRSDSIVDGVIRGYKDFGVFNICVALLAIAVPLADILGDWITLELKKIAAEEDARKNKLNTPDQ